MAEGPRCLMRMSLEDWLNSGMAKQSKGKIAEPGISIRTAVLRGVAEPTKAGIAALFAAAN